MILVLNAGSSSLKYKLFSIEKKVIFKDSYNNLRKRTDFIKALKNIKLTLDYKTKKYLPVDLIAHRVVHGGDLESPFLISNRAEFLKIEKFNRLAPLHNPVALTVIKESQKIFKNAKQVAVFDNAFFRELPEISQTLPINQKVARRLKIHRYGFHGISHRYVANQVDPENKLKIISIHLGAGSSMTAIDRGKPLETSMSFTPSDGLMMQTRSGALDPGIIFYLIRELGINRAED
jgi:acetate kinase